MKVTEALLGEHGALKAQFEHIEKALEGTEDLEHVRVLASLLESALATHAALEDDLLFPALEEALGPNGPLEVMRAEHDEIESTLQVIPDTQDGQQARAQLRHVLQVAREHFAKEEEVLFPMAERALGPEALRKMGESWSGRRRVRVL